MIFQKIDQRSEPFYMSATFCPPTFGGLRCQPDVIYVESKANSVKLLIIEDKTTNQPRYYSQLYPEAVILTDMHCLVAPAFVRKPLGVGGRSEERRAPFFPKLSGFEEYLVEATLNPYGSIDSLRDTPLKPIRFSENFHMVPGTEPKYFAVTQSKKKIMKALKHPQFVEVERSSQMRFTRRGKELKTFVPKDEKM